MAVTLIGEIVNSCDNTTGWNGGEISGDDDFVEGTGAIGDKVSGSTRELFTTNLGATAPYDFSSAGTEFGFHIILWINAKSPIADPNGIRVYVGDGTNSGHWDVSPFGFYKGGFITRVIDTASDFSTVSGWTSTGNPGQLTNITEMGAVMQAITSIMGNFNNFQIDQMIIGEGLRVDGGSSSTPNTFETVRVQDEDTEFWGWWSSKNGAFVGKGKLFIGPETGSTTSVFEDSAFILVFANERVATGFYEFAIRGGGTDVSWDLANIYSAETSVNSKRWNLTVDSTTNSFSDTNSVWSGADILSLNANSTLSGTVFVNCNSLIQNSATMDEISVLSASNGDGVAFITSDDPGLISNSSFEFSDGHAIEITTTGTFSFTGNNFTGYGADGTTDAAIFNNSGGSVTLNITDGNTPTVRNGAGASTTINISVPLEINGVTEGSRCVMIGNGGNEDGNILLAGYADSTGKVTGSFGGSTPQDVIVKARNSGIINAAILEDSGTGFTDFSLEARDKTGVDDVNLLPTSPAVDDAFYFGGLKIFEEVLINVTTAGSSYVLTWEYWNGSSWTSLSVTDNTNSFKTLGWNNVNFTAPSDWATNSVNSQGPFFYIRARVTSGGGNQPQAEEITLNKTIKYLPFQVVGTIKSGSGLISTAVWLEDSNAI